MSRGKDFWNKEYKTGEHLALSENPSEDLEKYCRFLERAEGRKRLNVTGLAVDFGCGNGRNLVYLARLYGMRGIGYDVSEEAIKQARALSSGTSLQYEARTIAGTFPNIKDGSVDLVLDMMSSHFLNETERLVLRDEIIRILKPDGRMFFKSFLADEDLHVKRLLKENAADEKNTYIHPRMGVAEHVWSLDELKEFWENGFEIEKIEKSFKHIMHGKAFKRRTVSVYLHKTY